MQVGENVAFGVNHHAASRGVGLVVVLAVGCVKRYRLVLFLGFLGLFLGNLGGVFGRL